MSTAHGSKFTVLLLISDAELKPDFSAHRQTAGFTHSGSRSCWLLLCFISFVLLRKKKNPHKKSGVTFIEPASLSVRQTTLQLFPTTTLLSDPQRSVNEKIYKKRTPFCPHSLLQHRPLCQFLVCILRTRRRSDNREALESPPPRHPPTLTPLHPDVGHMSRGIQASHSHRPRLPHRQPLHTWKEGSCLCALCLFLSFSFPSSLLPTIPRRRRLKGSAGLSGCFARERERERETVRVLARWHWIHGSCFLQCFMPIATAALQMRVNIAGGAVHPGSSLVAWPECQTGPSRVTPAQRTRCVTFFSPPPHPTPLSLSLSPPPHPFFPPIPFRPLLSADVSVCLIGSPPTGRG